MALSQWVDYIDVNHFGGRSAQVVIEALIHLVLHWEVLYGEGGRGREYERRDEGINRYDTAGPSGEGGSVPARGDRRPVFRRLLIQKGGLLR